MFKVLVVAIIFVAVLWTALPAAAHQQPSCANRAELLKHLSTNYEEAPVAMGLAANGGLLEVVASKDGSWTIIVTMPSGLSCGVASGLSWESITAPPPEEELL